LGALASASMWALYRCFWFQITLKIKYCIASDSRVHMQVCRSNMQMLKYPKSIKKSLSIVAISLDKQNYPPMAVVPLSIMTLPFHHDCRGPYRASWLPSYPCPWNGCRTRVSHACIMNPVLYGLVYIHPELGSRKKHPDLGRSEKHLAAGIYPAPICFCLPSLLHHRTRALSLCIYVF
jgi:hypothetical protein